MGIMRRAFSFLYLSLMLALMLALPAPAGAELIDNFGAWSAFVETEGGAKVCFIASLPQKAVGKYTKRGDVNLMVAHRPSVKTLNVISIDAGYTYLKGSDVTVTIGSNVFRLFTDGGLAWSDDAAADVTLVRAMRAGAAMTVHGTSSRGTQTLDTYSLSGFSAAHNAINKACGVR